MNKARHVYVTYIAVQPEKVWDALIDGEMTKQYWGHRNASDWKAGSHWEHQRSDGSNTVDIAGTVIETSRPRRLVITWTSPKEAGNPEKLSRVTFDLEPHTGGNTKLTVTHDELESGSEMERGITRGWPIVLSNLKSFLESGKTMPLR